MVVMVAQQCEFFLIPLDSIFKMVKIVNFVLYIFLYSPENMLIDFF